MAPCPKNRELVSLIMDEYFRYAESSNKVFYGANMEIIISTFDNIDDELILQKINIAKQKLKQIQKKGKQRMIVFIVLVLWVIFVGIVVSR